MWCNWKTGITEEKRDKAMTEVCGMCQCGIRGSSRYLMQKCMLFCQRHFVLNWVKLWDNSVISTSLYLCLCFVVCVWVCRIQPAGLVERIQAIAQNVSNMAIRVEQILQNSMVQGRGTVPIIIIIGVKCLHPLVLPYIMYTICMRYNVDNIKFEKRSEWCHECMTLDQRNHTASDLTYFIVPVGRLILGLILL